MAELSDILILDQPAHGIIGFRYVVELLPLPKSWAEYLADKSTFSRAKELRMNAIYTSPEQPKRSWLNSGFQCYILYRLSEGELEEYKKKAESKEI